MPSVTFVWKDELQDSALYANDQRIGAIQPYVHAHIRADDEVTEIDPGVFRWVRRFTSPTSIANVQLTMTFLVPQTMTYGMIPAVSYNGNPWGPGSEPKGFTQDGQAWTFAYHRTAVCAGTYSENADWSVALFAQEGFEGSCALVPSDQHTVHTLLLPECETPLVYTARDRYAPAYEAILSLEAGQAVTITAYLVVTPVEAPRQAWRHMLDTAWMQHRCQHKPRHRCEELWNWGIEYARESLWVDNGIFRGFAIGLSWIDQHWTPPVTKYEAGWCGQNISLANALLHDYLRNGSTSSLDKGLAALDCWATYAPLPNGLIRCHLEVILPDNEPEQELQDGCNLGSAAVYFFEAHQLAATCGVNRPNYQTIAYNICDFFVEHQFEDGNLGRAWRNDGTCAATDGTTGCFLIRPLLMAFQRSGEAKYLNAAKRAYAFYITGLVQDGFTAAGALDTHCIDKESSIPLLQAGLLLYELTGEGQYLTWAEHVAWYLASWQWHHTVMYKPGTALHALAYDTFGGTSVSTQHHHHDPFALAFVRDWMRLAELTGKDIWKQRALAVWANGMIGVSDGHLHVLNKKRPVGSQDEAFYETRWRDAFDVSEWLVAWPTAFRLEILRLTEDWSVLESLSS